jgi:hypothetical protein
MMEKSEPSVNDPKEHAGLPAVASRNIGHFSKKSRTSFTKFIGHLQDT